MTLYSLDSLAIEPLDNTRISALEENEILSLVHRELTAIERDSLLALAGVSGESCRAVARRYGVSPQTVCNRATAAKRRLQEKWGACI